MKVKTVDFKSPNAPREFTESFRETGFAVVSNHPIAPELIRESFKEWERFFASSEKTRYTYDPAKQAGYFPFRSENAKDYSIKDLKEFYHYYPWSELPRGTEKYTSQVFAQLVQMGTTLLTWIDENTPSHVRNGFSVPLSKMIEGSQENLLRPIHYPPLKGDEEAGAIRAAAHEDINMITLLPAATAPGLQVKDLAGRWHDVSCDTGNIVVNAGDMLKKASGNYYPSTTHQVVNPIGPESRLPRYSMPLFLHPRKDAVLSPGTTAGQYLNERLRAIGLLK